MKTLCRAALVGVVLLAVAGTWSPVSASDPIPFLVMKIEDPDITGGFTMPGYEGWMEVKSLGHEVVNPNGTSPSIGQFSLLKNLDSASVPLAYHAAMGAAFTKITVEYFTYLKWGNTRTEYRVELSNPKITLLRPSLKVRSRPDGANGTEEVFLGGFTEITWTFYRYNANGKLKEVITRSVPLELPPAVASVP